MATLKQLKTFIAVAETSKMSEAAKKLYLSQPTVSQIISDLEKEYESLFFKRFPKQLEITPMGKLFYERALTVVTSYENLNQFMKNSSTIRSLKVGVTLTIGDTMIGEIISRLRALYPDIETSVYIENTRILEHRLIHNELDLALVEGIITNDKIITEPTLDDHLRLICSTKHPFARRDIIKIEELRNETFIMREAGSGTRDIFETLMTARHIPINVLWESYSATAIIDAVRRNLGITVISSRYVKDHIYADKLHICPIQDTPMHRFFYLCYNQCHNVNTQMANFIEVVKSMF